MHLWKPSQVCSSISLYDGLLELYISKYLINYKKHMILQNMKIYKKKISRRNFRDLHPSLLEDNPEETEKPENEAENDEDPEVMMGLKENDNDVILKTLREKV